jgi:glutaminase A
VSEIFGIPISFKKQFFMETKLTINDIRKAVNEAYEKYKGNTDGANADYIPYLANVPKNLFGISVCLPNGQQIQVGDTDYHFGIESVSKVPTAILTMRQYGTEKLLEMIGADATGLPFNSIFAILLENDHPSTPLVNAGAISACSMVQPIGKNEEKWRAIMDNITDLCGTPAVLIDELYRSETATNYNNRAIAWLLKEYNRIYDHPLTSLDLYTRQCSLGITCEQLSVMAGTIAFGGRNPKTGIQVFDEAFVPQITSLIAAVGFYEHSGDWVYTSGIPAKSGVGGGIMGVLPGVFGISAFAPPLDESGNSVKGQLAIKYIMNKLNLNIYHPKRASVVMEPQMA